MIQKIKKFLMLLRYCRPVTRYELLIYRGEVAQLVHVVKELEMINRSEISKVAQYIQRVSENSEEAEKDDKKKTNNRGMFQ